MIEAGLLAELLTAKSQTLSVAESLTGGLISHTLTNIPGSSAWFQGGIIVYSNHSKVEMLGVSRENLEKFGAVSPQVAKEMADGVKAKFHTDFALSATGIAGPGGGSEEKPVGLVYLAVSCPQTTEVRKFLFSGNRLEIKQQTCQTAVNLALEFMRRDSIG